MNWSEEYKKSLKMKEVEEFFDLIFYRPVAFLFVRAVYNTGITPNSITIAAIYNGNNGRVFLFTWATGIFQNRGLFFPFV